MWYHKVIGNEKLPIVDTWWQTETGSIMIAPIPGAVPTKPGSCTKPLPGIAVEVVDEAGEILKQTDVGGYLVVSKPWPSMLRTIWGDNERYPKTYWGQFGNKRSEEHTSELQSLMRISYAVLCLKKKIQNTKQYDNNNI